MDTAHERGAYDDPNEGRQIAINNSQRRPHNRTRPGDSGEMVGEENVGLGRQEVRAVIFGNGSGRAGRIDAQCAFDEAAVKSNSEPIAEERCTKNTKEERAHTARYCRRIGFRASMPT